MGVVIFHGLMETDDYYYFIIDLLSYVSFEIFIMIFDKSIGHESRSFRHGRCPALLKKASICPQNYGTDERACGRARQFVEYEHFHTRILFKLNSSGQSPEFGGTPTDKRGLSGVV